MTFSYYVTGNTAEGFVNYIDSNIKDMERIVVLKHGSNKIKTFVIQEIISKHRNEQDMEVLLSSLGEKYLEGVLLKESSIAVLTDQIAPSERELEVLNLEMISRKNVDEHEKEQQQEYIQHFFQQAYDHFSTGLSIHDQLENVYVDQMDFSRADELADKLVHDLVGSTPERKETGSVYERLFGTNTTDGAVNIVPEIIAPITNVTFIKGRAGTGKSTFMKKIADACVNRGMDIEQYRCSFDPNGIDMVVIRDIDFCIFDSTDPHEFFPRNEHDQVIDLYEETVATGTDELFAEQIRELTAQYKSYMKQGMQALQEAGKVLDSLEENYTLATRKQVKQWIEHNIV